MKDVNQNYSTFYNKLFVRSGPLFNNRFYSQEIYSQKHLSNCLAYIHNNPVKANIVAHCKDYNFSSYIDYMNFSGIATKKNIELLFGYSENYLPSFFQIHNKNFYFYDIDLDFPSIVSEKMQNFCKQKKCSLSDINNNYTLQKSAILYLSKSDNYIKIPNQVISSFLQISTSKINYILSHNQ